MAAPVLRPLSTGEVLDVSFGLYRALFFPLLVISIVSRAIPAVLQIYIQALGGDFASHWVLTILALLLGIILSSLGIAATTFVVAGAYLGHSVTADNALRSATGLLGRIIAVSLMTSLIVGLASLLLIIPGIIVFTGLALATAVVVLEAPISANDAMSRSWKLTKGDKGKVFLTLLVAALLLVVPVVVASLIGLFGTALHFWSALAPMVLSTILGLFVYPFIYVVITVLYYDMRVRKEGFDLELLAAATRPG